MTFKLPICLAAVALLLAGCSKSQSARQAPAQGSAVSSTYNPTDRPVALTPDGSDANTGNRVNGTQDRTTAVGRVAADAP